jgi:HSP20 family molecular chaperone IbpA
MEMDTQQAPARRGTEAPALLPPVDIVEDESGITVKADLPGVSRESLAIHVDGETLTVEGTVALGEPQKMEAVYAEIRVARYRRSFVLGRDLDTERIDAAMKNGVLTLHVPKREQAKPRRIPVKAA